MRKLVTLGLGLLVVAAFSKTEGNYFKIDFFALSSHKVILPEYLYTHCIRLAFISHALTMYWQETKYKNALKIFSGLIIGNWIDFTLTGSIGWFRMKLAGYDYVFSYDSFQFIVFSGILLWEVLNDNSGRI